MDIPSAVIELILRRAEWFRRDQERDLREGRQQSAREHGLQAVTLEILVTDLQERKRESVRKNKL